PGSGPGGVVDRREARGQEIPESLSNLQNHEVQLGNRRYVVSFAGSSLKAQSTDLGNTAPHGFMATVAVIGLLLMDQPSITLSARSSTEPLTLIGWPSTARRGHAVGGPTFRAIMCIPSVSPITLACSHA